MRESLRASRSSMRGEPRDRSWVVVHDRAQGFGRGLDRRRRRLELVGCVRDEVAADRLDAAGVGDIGHDHEDRAFARQRGGYAQPARRALRSTSTVIGADDAAT